MKGAGVLLSLLGLVLVPGIATSDAGDRVLHVSTPDVDVDVVGDVDGTRSTPLKALQDTIWIANWSFDTGMPCDEQGWTHEDGYILNDGAVHWHVETGFTTTTGMQGRAAAVGDHENSCCTSPDGYDNDWYQAIRLTYTGAATLSLDYIADTEPGFDFLQVETDSACASFDRVDYDLDPFRGAVWYRDLLAEVSGLVPNGEWNDIALPDYEAGPDCVYIAFFSDGGYSPCDGVQPTTIGEAIVIDNLVLTDASGTRSEDFEDGTLDIGTFLNIADSKPFGTWARLYPHISDNDLCAENTTCAWLWTDHTTPTVATYPGMDFGPGRFVVKKYLDDRIISPWVNLAGTPTASGTVLRFRRFPGNYLIPGCIVQGWSVRGLHTVAGHTCADWSLTQYASLSTFRWLSMTADMTTRIPPGAEAIQVRFRTTDWGFIANCAPAFPWFTGPGPYLDDVRIGRVILHGPAIGEGVDARTQAQDCFPTEIHPGVTPAGEHYRPTTDRFGTCAFSPGLDLASRTGWNLITGDSVTVEVRGARPGGETVTAVTWYGAIVRGPHAGKSPAPFAVGANGFFAVVADTVRSSSGSVLADNYFVDLDDTYFRGGDELRYFWAATDNGGGFASDPAGLAALPVSLEAAEAATGGLLEASFLPTIAWAPAYLARVAADAHGDLTPTTEELAASSQSSCILYVNHINARRRSGDVNRTTFMYAFDRLGYRGEYDVYDHSGMGDTNNHLGSRATVPQAQGYSLIVYDTGDGSPSRPLVPSGTSPSHKVDQGGWFQDWLAQAGTGATGFATLWLVGANFLQEDRTLPLYADMGATFLANNQTMGLNPEVRGMGSFAFDRGDAQTSVDFTDVVYVANGGCPTIRDYDALGATGTGVASHVYGNQITGSLGSAAILMNSSPTQNWNTILQSHAFFDIRSATGPQDPLPELGLLETILGATLPLDCIQSPTPTGTREGAVFDVPVRTVLHPNIPNPFNPTTTIRFDLARSGKVQLRIYDAAGRLRRTLVDAEVAAGRDLSVPWNGLDDQSRSIPSGIYFCRLDAPDAHFTQKLVFMK